MAENKIWAYTRVSTREQSCLRQQQQIEEYAATHGLTIDRIFEEKASGKNFQDRPVWQSLKLTTMRAGDLLILTEIDRLGRDYEQIKNEYSEIEKMGVDIVILENELLSTRGKSDLERKLIGDIVFSLLSYCAQKERMKLKERQAAGIALARADKKFKGKPKTPAPANFESVYVRWTEKKITALVAMSELGIKKDVFYRLVKERKGN